MIGGPERSVATRLRAVPWELILPAVAALVVGFLAIDRVGLWGDERVTWEGASAPLSPQLEPPLIPYYGAMWLWSLTGDVTNDAWLRTPSAVAVCVAAIATALTGRMLRGRRVALAAGLLIAVSPGVARYANEARVYAIALGLAAVATALFVKGVRDNRRRWWVWYAVVLALLGLLSPFAYAIVAGHGTLLFTTARYRWAWRRWIVACLANVPVIVAVYGLSRSVPDFHDWLTKPTVDDFLPGLGGISVYAGFGMLLVGIGIATRQGRRWVLATMVALASLWLLSQGPMSFWIERSLLPLSPLVAIAAGIAFGRMRLMTVAAVLALIGCLAFPTIVADRQPGARGLDPKAFAAMVDRMAQPGDVINTAINDWFSWGVARYSIHPDQYTYAPSSTGRAWVLDKDVPCTRLAEYPVPGGDSLLVLCESLPAGWENRVVRG